MAMLSCLVSGLEAAGKAGTSGSPDDTSDLGPHRPGLLLAACLYMPILCFCDNNMPKYSSNLFFVFETGSHYAVQASLEPTL